MYRHGPSRLSNGINGVVTISLFDSDDTGVSASMFWRPMWKGFMGSTKGTVRPGTPGIVNAVWGSSGVSDLCELV